MTVKPDCVISYDEDFHAACQEGHLVGFLTQMILKDLYQNSYGKTDHREIHSQDFNLT